MEYSVGIRMKNMEVDTTVNLMNLPPLLKTKTLAKPRIGRRTEKRTYKPLGFNRNRVPGMRSIGANEIVGKR